MSETKDRALPNHKPFFYRGRLVLVVLWILFIWSRSLFAGPESSAQSNFVVTLIQPVFEALGVTSIDTMGFIVRKAAHFTEYTILGVLLAWANPDKHIMWCEVVCGIAVPSCDETIQLFVPGRSGQLSDVMLDCAGVAFGMFLVMLYRRSLKR